MTTDLRPPNAPAQALFGNRFLTEPAPSTHFPQGARRGRFGGWAGYVCDGRVKFIYHVLGIHEFTTMAEAPIPEGTRQVRIKFAYDGGGLAKGGDVTLYSRWSRLQRTPSARGDATLAHESAVVGYESGTTVTPDYTTATSRFTGKINWVQIDLGDDAHDHVTDPEDRLRVAMARQ